MTRTEELMEQVLRTADHWERVHTRWKTLSIDKGDATGPTTRLQLIEAEETHAQAVRALRVALAVAEEG